MVARYEVERLVLTGASAGGYAALAFGRLLDADLVLSFSPQTVIDPHELEQMGDHRWDRHLGPLAASGALDTAWSDLRVALGQGEGNEGQDGRRQSPHPRVDGAGARQKGKGPQYKLFFDEQTTFDRMHAERLRDVPGVSLLRFGGGSHNLVRTLRDRGALAHLLATAVDPSSSFTLHPLPPQAGEEAAGQLP